MGQIVSSAAKPMRCNRNELSQLGVLAAGQHVLVSSDNSMNAAGQGNFDCYIVGVGNVAAIDLPLHNINEEKEALANLLREIQIDNGTDTLYVTDADGNIVAKIDADGVHSIGFYDKDGNEIVASGDISDAVQVDNEKSVLYITDNDGDVIAKIDAMGIHSVGYYDKAGNEITAHGGQSVAFDSFKGSATLGQNEALCLAKNHVSKNTLLVAKIGGTISSVSIGVGYSTNSTYLYRDYNAYWVEIDTTNVKLYSYWNGSSWRLDQTYTHGLTLTGHTIVSVESTMSNDGVKTNTLKIFTDKGDVWTQAVNWGMGIPFVTNNGASDISAELKFFARDITHKVWLFGDSMFSYWPPKVQAMGFVNYLCNYLPGLNPAGAYADLQSLLALGYKPTYILWCLGANGELNAETYSDGEWHISAMQKGYIDNVISLCEDYGITPVFMVVPTFPTRQRTGFANYLHSLNVRLWDLAGAVQSDEYGIWHASPSLLAWHNATKGYIYTAVRNSESPMGVGNYLFDSDGDKLTSVITAIGDSTISTEIDGATYVFDRSSANDISGIVSSDGIHPTPNGANVYAQSVLTDFPELSIVE